MAFGAPAARPSWAAISIAFWVTAIAVSLAGYAALVLPFLPVYGLGRPIDFFFLVAPIVEVLALAFATAAFGTAWRTGHRIRIFAIALALFAVVMVSTVLASVSWYTNITCAGGQAGPCATPLYLCGFGLLSAIGAAIVAVVGILRLRRVRVGPILPS